MCVCVFLSDDVLDLFPAESGHHSAWGELRAFICGTLVL